MALLQAAAYAQFVRQSVVSAFHQDYVRTAIAKGVPMRLVFFKHVLRNIGIPLVTFMGLILIQILGGAVIIESVFALPGLGRLLLTSIETRDYPVLQGALLVVVVIAMAVNLAVDLLYRVIDPRVRSDLMAVHARAVPCVRRSHGIGLGHRLLREPELGDRRRAACVRRGRGDCSRACSHRNRRSPSTLTRRSSRPPPRICSEPTTSAAMSSRASFMAPASPCRSAPGRWSSRRSPAAARA